MQKKLISLLIVTLLIIVFASVSTISTSAVVRYDREAARAYACNDNRNDGGYYGNIFNEDLSIYFPQEKADEIAAIGNALYRGYIAEDLGRFSSGYIASVLDAGGISITDIDFTDVFSFAVIQEWMTANPSAWEFVSRRDLEAGDFVLFTSHAGVSEENWQPHPDYYFEHGAVFLGRPCENVRGFGEFATWNNERLNISIRWVKFFGFDRSIRPKNTLYVHILANDLPNAPTYISPLDGAQDVSVDADIEWEMATDPDGDTVTYTVRFGKNPDVTGGTFPAYAELPVMVIDDTALVFSPQNEAIPRGGLLPNTSYCYHVTSRDNHGNENPSAPVACFTTTYVRQPQNFHSSANTINSIMLGWEYDSSAPPNPADQYEIEWSTDGNDWNEIFYLDDNHPVPVDTLTFNHIRLDCNKFNYHYRIRAYRAADNLYSTFSEPLRATTQSCSFDAPILVSPEDGTQFLNSDPMPQFEWMGTSLAETYELLIRNDSGNVVYRSGNFAADEYCNPNTRDCAILTPDMPPTNLVALPDDSSLTWEIRANHQGTYQTSLRWHFIRTAYAIPIPIAPIGEITTGRGDLTYVWTTVPDATSYTLKIYNATGIRIGQPLVVAADSCNEDTCSFRPSDVDRNTFLLTNNTYQWEVESSGINGTSYPSERVEFTLNIPDAGLVDLIAPDTEILDTATPTFTWLPVPSASEYQLEIRIQTSTVYIPQNIYHDTYCTETLCEYTVPDVDALRNNDYTWRARVLNSPTGTGAFDELLPFTISVGEPSAFNLISPTDGSTQHDYPVVFQWEDAADTATYQLRVHLPNVWASQTVETTSCRDGICSSTLIEGLPEGHTIEWEVLANNRVGETLSERWLFDTDFMPDTITLISPEDEAIISAVYPSFTWEDDNLGRIETYIVEVALGSDITSYSVEAAIACSDGSCELNLAEYEPLIVDNQLFRWRVRGTRAGVIEEAVSEWWDFEANVLPARPQLIAPIADAAVTTITPTLTWDADVRFVRFSILIRRDNNNDMLVQIDDVSATANCNAGSCSINIGDFDKLISDEGRMNWLVYGYTSDGLESLSNLETFVASDLIPTAIVLESPADGSTTDDVNLSFIWVHDERLQHYSLEVRQSADGSLVLPPVTVLASACTATCEVDLSDYPETLNTIGGYDWIVTGYIDGFTRDVSSPRWDFTLDTLLPPNIQLVAPANAAIVRQRDPIFEWRDDSRIEEYQITILNQDRSIHYQSEWLPSDETLCPDTCQFDLNIGTLLATETLHYWSVIGRRASFAGEVTSNERSFTLRYEEPPIVQTAPTANHIFRGADDTPTFVWVDDGTYDSFDIVLYQVNAVIGTIEGIRADDAAICHDGACHYDMAANGQVVPKQGNELYWRVIGHIDNYESTGQSPRRRFQIRDVLPADAPTLVSPAHRTIVYDPTPTTFVWTHDERFDEYILIIRVNNTPIYEISVDATTHCDAENCSITNTDFPFTEALQNQTFWAVQGIVAGMDAVPRNLSDSWQIRQHLMPEEIVYIAPRINPITNINTSFRWQPDEHNRVDDWLIEVKNRDTNIIFASKWVETADVCAPEECFYQFTNDLLQYDRNRGEYSWRLTARRYTQGGDPNMAFPAGNDDPNIGPLSVTGTWTNFPTNFRPDVPILRNPSQNGNVPLDVTVFEWQGDAASRASEYEVRVFDADGNQITTGNNVFQAITVNDSVGICNPEDVAPFLLICTVLMSEIETTRAWGNGSYQWQVIALNSIVENRGGIASDIWTFTMTENLLGSPDTTFNADGFRINVPQPIRFACTLGSIDKPYDGVTLVIDIVGCSEDRTYADVIFKICIPTTRICENVTEVTRVSDGQIVQSTRSEDGQFVYPIPYTPNFAVLVRSANRTLNNVTITP